jgi:hypothetical protein
MELQFELSKFETLEIIASATSLKWKASIRAPAEVAKEEPFFNSIACLVACCMHTKTAAALATTESLSGIGMPRGLLGLLHLWACTSSHEYLRQDNACLVLVIIGDAQKRIHIPLLQN